MPRNSCQAKKGERMKKAVLVRPRERLSLETGASRGINLIMANSPANAESELVLVDKEGLGT